MRVITLDSSKKVIGVKNVGDSYSLQPNDISTELGEMGQIQQADGSFINDTTPIISPVKEPTNQEINENLMVIMNGLTDIYMLQLGL